LKIFCQRRDHCGFIRRPLNERDRFDQGADHFFGGG
jgi:hypothetical protein